MKHITMYQRNKNLYCEILSCVLYKESYYIQKDKKNFFFYFQPAVLDNLLGSMKYVLTGMGLLRINLENPKNRVCY